jgi:hypothetical protein
MVIPKAIICVYGTNGHFIAMAYVRMMLLEIVTLINVIWSTLSATLPSNSSTEISARKRSLLWGKPDECSLGRNLGEFHTLFLSLISQ